jgi:hypothetical protein
MKTDYTADAVKWVSRAVYKPSKNDMRKEERKQLWLPYQQEGYTVASDGFRAHVVYGELPVSLSESYPNIATILKYAHTGDITGEFSKWHLVTVAKVLGVYARESKNILKMSLNGSLEASAKSAESGDGSVVIIDGDEWTERFAYPKSSADSRRITKNLTATQRYNNAFIYNRAVFTHKGNDITFAVDYKLLLDALSGMPDIVQYRMKDNASSILLSGEVGGVLREAVLMPMFLPR